MPSTRAGRQGLVMGLLALMLGAPVVWTAEQRDLVVMPKVAPGSVAIGGEYRALIIGIDKYRHVPPLGTAVRDALALRDMLLERYGFKPDHITLVVNDQATQRGIVDALYRLRKQAGKDDSVLIYYAGHGQIDADDGMGYWVPVEGEAHSPGTFLSNAVIRDEIANMKAKHVYVVADSCFAGTLFAKSRTLPPLNDKFFARLYATKSRWGLTSGQNEPVTDRGKDGHSIFAYFLLKLLGENEDPYLVPSHIYDQLAPLVGRNTEQQPRSEPLQNAGDEGGQFVFRLAAVGPVKPGPATGAEAFLQAERKRLEEERSRLEAEKAAMATEQQMLKERARLETERKQVEAERKYQATVLLEKSNSANTTNDAIAYLDDAIRFDPSLANAWGMRGFYYQILKEHEQSIADFTEAIRLDPQPDWYVARGTAFLDLGKPRRAIADADEAIRRNPNSGEGYELSAHGYFREGKYAEAVTDYTKAIKFGIALQELGTPRLYRARGLAHLELYQYQEAIADFTQAIQKIDDLVKARPAFGTYSPLKELRGDNLLSRGTGYASLGGLNEAMRDYKQACALGNEQGCHLLESR